MLLHSTSVSERGGRSSALVDTIAAGIWLAVPNLVCATSSFQPEPYTRHANSTSREVRCLRCRVLRYTPCDRNFTAVSSSRSSLLTHFVASFYVLFFWNGIEIVPLPRLSHARVQRSREVPWSSTSFLPGRVLGCWLLVSGL